MDNPKAALTRRIEQVPNEPVIFSLGAYDASPPEVVGECLSRKKAKSSSILFHQVIDVT